MTPPVPALAEFADRLRTASWFSVIGDPLTSAERQDASSYLATLGFDGVSVAEVESWSAAEACIKTGH